MTGPLTRRDWLWLAGATALPLHGFGRSGVVVADEQPGLAALNRFPRMVHEQFVAQVRAADDAGNEARAALTTKADAASYIAGGRARIRNCFGPLPEKPPLTPRVTGKVERDAYLVERITFESRPGFLVTANLYVPTGMKLPRPGVIGSCGHSNNGKAAEAYQSFA